MSPVRFDQTSQPLKIRTPPSSNGNGRPKPCLKSPIPERDPLPFSEYRPHSPHVHFPPTPTLTSTSFTHSSNQYDRAPIVVTENVCALPERGGRCYEAQAKNKRSSSRANGRRHSGSGSSVGTGGVEADPSGSRAFNPPEPIGSYFHPRAYEACEPERRLKDQRAQYNPYFPPYPSFSDLSLSSSSSSESDSDLDVSYSSLSPSLIPRAAIDSLSLNGAPSSTYPSDSSLLQQNGLQRPRQLSHPLGSRQSYQQSQHIVHYSSPSSSGECRQKSVTSGGSRRVNQKGSSSTSTSARLPKFGGGFSDQSMVLDGCLGGF